MSEPLRYPEGHPSAGLPTWRTIVKAARTAGVHRGHDGSLLRWRQEVTDADLEDIAERYVQRIERQRAEERKRPPWQRTS